MQVKKMEYLNHSLFNLHYSFPSDVITRAAQMRLPAARTAAGTGKTPAVFKHIAALETFAGSDRQFTALGRQRPGDVSQVLIDFLFLDTDPLRQFPGIHLPLS